MKANLTTSAFILCVTTVLGAGALTSCKKKPETLGDKVKDGLNVRPNEKLKDAGENLQDAAKDTTEAVKDALKK